MAFTVLTGLYEALAEPARQVRRAVFVVEQQVPLALDEDGSDAECFHVVLLLGDTPVATGRLAPDGKLGRLAVLAAHRGQGLGRQLMALLEAEAGRRGLLHVHLHAQQAAAGFYERLGYGVSGPPFDEAGIAHVPMEKALREATPRPAGSRARRPA